MAVIVNGDGILTGVSSLTTALDDITSGRGTITGVTTVGTLQLGTGVSISSPRTQNAAIFTNNTEFLTVDDAGRVGVGTVTPNSDVHPQNVGKINVGFITARSVAGDIDANTLVVAGISTFVGAINGSGANLTNLNASNIASGTVPTARLGSGTANNTTFLRGDSTFAVVTSTTINTNADNRLITGSGTADTLNGESTLTYDGDGLLNMTSASGPAEITLVAPSANDSGIYFNDGSNDGAVSYDHSTQNMTFRANGVSRVKFDGPNNRILLKRTPSSDVDIVLAKAQQWGYSSSYQGVIIGNPAVGNMSSLFLNVDVSGNPSGAFTGDGREVVFRNNARFVIPESDNDGFKTPIALNMGATTEGVPRFKQGLLFGSDTADANILEDYEEGTWTPLPEFGGGLTGGAYTTANCNYTKIGRSVTIKGNINFSSRGSSTGGFKITGLPFTDNYSGNYSHSVGSVIVFFGPNADGSMTCFTSSSQLRFRMHNEANDNQEPQHGDFDNDTKIMFSITYFTNS